MHLLKAALIAVLVAPRIGVATIDVHMIGDSTMADRTDPKANPEVGWGTMLPQFLSANVAVHNHAANGRSTKSFIDEGKWAAVLAALKPGDYVFIEFGHNDEKSEDTTRYAAPRAGYRTNLERFVNESRAKGALPVLFTPIVRRKFNASGLLENTHGVYPDVVRETAVAMKVPLIDLQRLTAELVERAGPEDAKKLYVWVPANTWSLYPEGRQDDTHLTRAGATAVARLAARGLAASDLPLAREVRGLDR